MASANPIREADIETGLWTLRFLAITLAITLIRRIFGWNWIVNCRRILSLFTFAYACVHLSMWAAVEWAFDLRRHGSRDRKAQQLYPDWNDDMAAAVGIGNHIDERFGASAREAADLVASTRRSHGGDHSLLWAVKQVTFFPLVYVAAFVAPLLHRGLVRRPTSMSTGRPRSSAPLAP